MQKKKPKFVPGRTVIKRVGIDTFVGAVERVLSGSSKRKEVLAINAKHGPFCITEETLRLSANFARKVGIKAARAEWEAPHGNSAQ